MIDKRLRRHELGFLELVDKPSPEELSSYYETKYYQDERANYRKEYSNQELAVIESRIALRHAKIKELNVMGGGGNSCSLLDVGCGEGFVLRYFSKQGWQVKGIDFSRAGVEQINPEYAGFVEQGDVFHLLAEHIEFRQKYDLVWLGNVLEHVLDPIALLKSLKSLVANDGLLVVTVPNDGNLFHERLFLNKKIATRWWIAVPDHISYFTAESLRKAAKAAGWETFSIMADFPIDWYLAHDGSNYIANKANGPFAHQARLFMEELIAGAGFSAANQFYESLAGVGLGRDITAYLSPREKMNVADYKVMPVNFLTDGVISLRSVVEQDIEKIRLWRNAQMDVLRQSRPISPEEQKKYFAEFVWPEKELSNPRQILLSIFEEEELIGYGGLVNIKWDDLRAEVSFLLSPEVECIQIKRAEIFERFLEIIKSFSFEHLRLQRLWTETYAHRKNHICSLENAQFVYEGCMRHQALINEEPTDSLIHGILIEDYFERRSKKT